MRKLFIVKLILLFITFNTFSQEKVNVSSKIKTVQPDKVNWSETLVNKEGTFRLKLKDEKKIRTMGVGRLIIEIVNHKTKKSKTHNLEEHYWYYNGFYSDKVNRYFFEKLLEDDKGQVWLFLSTFGGNKHKLYRRELKADGSLGRNIFVTERSIEKHTTGDKVENAIYFATTKPWYSEINVNYDIRQSENKKTYSIITYASDKKKKRTKFNIEVKDQNFQTLWKMSNYLDAESTTAKFRDIVLTDEGTLIGLLKYRNSEQRSDIFYKLYVFKKGEKQFLDYPIHHDEKNIHSLRITETVDHNIVISGFYNQAKKNYRNKIEGLYFLSLDMNPLQLITESFTPFTKEDVKTITIPEIRPFYPNQKGFKAHQDDLLKGWQKRKDNLISDNHYPLKLISHKNNTFTLVVEKANYEGHIRYGLQLFNFNNFGKLNWIRSVERWDQITQKAPTSAQGTQIHKMFDQSLIIYKDKIKTIMLFVDSDGQIQQNEINDYVKRDKYMLYPLHIKKIGDHDFRGLLYNKAAKPNKGKEYKYLYINLKETNKSDAK
ncbi:hypothetical protein [Flammeovirga aprica]|uniref:Uncharacterized protein n=1 Tax=Flammeovirga aprica JL-4 TaxID=694437 RepID=A0A7X9P2G6_9BACT|nr:hypothetical protein [Flammeovirga aprica]NME68105.1 hypothetical protein [Flammeovirga aprica JL-4]